MKQDEYNYHKRLAKPSIGKRQITLLPLLACMILSACQSVEEEDNFIENIHFPKYKKSSEIGAGGEKTGQLIIENNCLYFDFVGIRSVVVWPAFAQLSQDGDVVRVEGTRKTKAGDKFYTANIGEIIKLTGLWNEEIYEFNPEIMSPTNPSNCGQNSSLTINEW